MATMNVSLPVALKEFAEVQVGDRGFGTMSSYVRELIRRDRDRQRLRNLLLEGAQSPPAVLVDEKWFADLRASLRDLAGE